jgi:hypothetical protein
MFCVTISPPPPHTINAFSTRMHLYTFNDGNSVYYRTFYSRWCLKASFTILNEAFLFWGDGKELVGR